MHLDKKENEKWNKAVDHHGGEMGEVEQGQETHEGMLPELAVEHRIKYLLPFSCGFSFMSEVTPYLIRQFIGVM